MGCHPSTAWNLLRNQQELASGSFGTVYSACYGDECMHSDDAQKVVVKKLKGECAESKRRFLKEAEMLNSVSHANIPLFTAICKLPLTEHLKQRFKKL